MEFIASGLGKDITCLGFEAPRNRSWAQHIQLSPNEKDCLYFELVVSSMPLYLNSAGGIRILEEQRMVCRLLAIAKQKNFVAWNQQQACTFKLIALDVLIKIVPHTEEEFIENSGPTVLLEIINLYRTKDYDILIFKKCLEALFHISKNTTTVLDSIIFNHGFNLILDLCEDFINNCLEDTVGKECLGLVFCTLDLLCKHPHSNLEADRIIPTTLKYLTYIVSPHKEVYVRDVREIVCVLNFVWEHIIKVEEMAKVFVQKGGTYLMLDIVQKFPFVVKLVALGALVDLCEYGLCIPYLITWKRNGKTIIPMLMKLFRDENKRNKVKTGKQGQIHDIRYPLMGRDQWFLTFCRCKPMMPGNVCISDLFLSLRPKIYAILQMLHLKHQEKVDVANEHYKTFDEELSIKDQVTKLVAENFLALKLGEAWVELKEEFQRTSVTLTELDKTILSDLTQQSSKFSHYLLVLQNDIITRSLEKDIIGEMNLYKHIQDSQLTDALEALGELKYIARSCENMFRISEKYKQTKQIDDTQYAMDVVHRTSLDIRVTPVFNQSVDLTRFVHTADDEDEIIPVSPTDSQHQCNIDIPEDLFSSSEIKLSCPHE